MFPPKCRFERSAHAHHVMREVTFRRTGSEEQNQNQHFVTAGKSYYNRQSELKDKI